MKILSYITHKILVTLLRQLLPIALGALMDSVLRGVHSLSDSVDEMELQVGVGGKSALDDAKEDEEDLYLPPFCECHGMRLSFANLYLTVTLTSCNLMLCADRFLDESDTPLKLLHPERSFSELESERREWPATAGVDGYQGLQLGKLQS